MSEDRTKILLPGCGKYVKKYNVVSKRSLVAPSAEPTICTFVFLWGGPRFGPWPSQVPDPLVWGGGLITHSKHNFPVTEMTGTFASFCWKMIMQMRSRKTRTFKIYIFAGRASHSAYIATSPPKSEHWLRVLLGEGVEKKVRERILQNVSLIYKTLV